MGRTLSILNQNKVMSATMLTHLVLGKPLVWMSFVPVPAHAGLWVDPTTARARVSTKPTGTTLAE